MQVIHFPKAGTNITTSFVSPSIVLNAVPGDGMLLLLTDRCDSPLNELSTCSSFGVVERQETCSNETVQEKIIADDNFASRIELPEECEPSVAGWEWSLEKGAVQWGLFSSIQMPPLTLIASLSMSQLEEKYSKLENCLRVT